MATARKEALEEKRRRLEEMRRLRDSRLADDSNKPPPAHSSTTSSSSSLSNDRAEVDDLVNSLLTPSPSSAPLSSSSSSLSSSASASASTTSISSPTPLSSAQVKEQLLREKAQRLSTIKSVCSVHIFPTPPEMYDKNVQTDTIDVEMEKGNEDDFSADLTPTKNGNKLRVNSNSNNNSRGVGGPAAPSSPKTSSGGGDNSPMHKNSDAGDTQPLIGSPSPEGKPAKFYTEEEKREISSSKDFTTFLDKTSRVLERALCLTNVNGSDVIRDYKSAIDSARNSASNKTLTLSNVFENEFVKNRPVMDLHCSPHYPELFLAAYGSVSSSSLSTQASIAVSSSSRSISGSSSSSSSAADEDSPGAVVVWSSVLKNRPEFIFVASSPVLTARFHDQDPHLVIGGCYSGQILLWDMRAKALPVQRSSMAGKGHKHPVYSMCMIGTATMHELVSISTDGTLCHWDLTRLTEPTSITPMQIPSSSSASSSSSSSTTLSASNSASTTGSSAIDPSRLYLPMTISSMAYNNGESSKDIIFGSGNGTLIRTTLPFRPHDPVQQVEAHSGLVTAIHMHPSNGKNFKDLLLTSSFDWTVKLWNLSCSKKPLLEFYTQSYDYICDVKWSPVYPSVFSTITCGGELSLWDISRSTTSPIDSLKILKSLDSSSNSSSNSNSSSSASPFSSFGALNRGVWSSDGRSYLVGDARGVIHQVLVQDSVIKNTGELGLFDTKAAISSAGAGAGVGKSGSSGVGDGNAGVGAAARDELDDDDDM